MKKSTIYIFMFILLGGYGCSSKPSTVEFEQALAYCERLLSEFTDPSAMLDHVSAVKKNSPGFFESNGENFRPKNDIEFSSQVESNLYDCVKQTDKRLEDLAKAI